MTADLHNFYTQQIPTKLQSVEPTPNGLEVYFSANDSKHLYPWFWVRDHSIDADSLDQLTTQRIVETFAIPADISCNDLELDQHNQLIHFTWNDKSKSTISAYMLASVVGLTPAKHQLAPYSERILWDKHQPLDELPSLQFESVMQDDAGLLEWLHNIHIYGFCMLEGVPPNEASTTALAQRVGVVQETIFGGMWPLSSELTDHGDTAYTTSFLEPHTDSTYYHDAPGLQMFNCLQFDGKGGESIQVDGFAIAAQIKRDDPEAYKTLTEISVQGHYLEPGVHLHAERPALRLDSKDELIQLSFNNYDRAPTLMTDAESKRFQHAYGLLHKHVTDQDNWLKIPLTPGRTLIFDNWRNLHGRMGYVGKRVFYGCYHSRSVFESKIRVLQAALG